jgi:ATPase with chaperone activity
MRNIRLTLDDSAVSLIAQNGYSKEYGARQLSRSIQKMIEDELSKMILKKQIKDNDEIKVSVKDEKLSFSVK